MNVAYNSPKLDNALQALANHKRRGIIHDLSFHPETVKRLARDHQLTLPAIHKHILILESSDMIIRKKSGRTNFVALNNKTLSLVQNWIIQYNTKWGSEEATLENYISRMQE